MQHCKAEKKLSVLYHPYLQQPYFPSMPSQLVAMYMYILTSVMQKHCGRVGARRIERLCVQEVAGL